MVHISAEHFHSLEVQCKLKGQYGQPFEDSSSSGSSEVPANDSCCEVDGASEGVTDRLQLVVAGVELWSRMYLSTLLVFAWRTALFQITAHS